jgi:hypothetical protein
MEERMKKVIYAMLVLFLLYLTGSFVEQAQAEGPKLLIPQTIFDFGNVPPQSIISHYYLVKNVGDDTLKIQEVKPG